MAEDQESWTSRTFWIKFLILTFITSVLGLFLQPVLTWLSNVTVSAIGFFYAGYIDGLYYDAAANPADHLIYIVFAFIGFTPFTLAYVSLLTRRTRDETKTRFSRPVLIIILGIMVIPLLIILAGPAVSIRANATFQRRLMALTPVISEEERKQLLGKWAMVQSQADYERIRIQMEELAKQYHTTLPRPSQYSLIGL